MLGKKTKLEAKMGILGVKTEKKRFYGPENAASVGPVQMVSRQHPAARMSNGNSKSAMIDHTNFDISMVLEMDLWAIGDSIA